jgi:fatty-acyl-CoA synthase
MDAGDIAGRRAVYTPDNLAVIDAGKSPHLRLTYRDLNTRANRLASWLRAEAGVRKGDRVGILARDGIEYLDAFFACNKLGAILACYNWRLHVRELIDIMHRTQPKVVLHSGEFSALVVQIRPAVSSVTQCITIETEGAIDSIPLDDILRVGPEVFRNAEMGPEDIACLIFTGGTTGLPKAAMISHRMIAWNTLNTIIHDLRHGDVTVNVFPMFHTGGLLVYTIPLLILGGTVVLTRRFDPEQVLDLLQTYSATVFAGVPTIYQMLTTAANWPTADLSGLRFCTSGGAPLPVPLIEKFRAEKNTQFKQGFGMTECGPGIFALAPEDALRKAGSIGRPNFFVGAQIVDGDMSPLPPNQIGELVLKGPSLASGYFGSGEPITDQQGWFHTGDLAMRDEENYFFIVDRKKDMFISGGENVYPAEIEQALYRHPDVQMCAVIGVPDTQWGEVGKAFVVLKTGALATSEAIIAHLRDHLARFKVPKTIAIVESLPMSAAGKILKRELRERHLVE